MLWQLVLLHFFVHFNHLLQAVVIPSATKVVSAVQTGQTSTQGCIKFDMTEEGCNSDNDCEIDNMAYMFCPPSKFASTLANSCASGDAANGNINYIPLSIKTKNHWSVFCIILQKYFQNQKYYMAKQLISDIVTKWHQFFSLGMEFNGFFNNIYELSDGDTSTSQLFNISDNDLEKGAVDRYIKVAYTDSWKSETNSRSAAYTICVIDDDSTQLTNSSFATVVKESSSTYYYDAYFFNLKSSFSVGHKNCSYYNGTMATLADILTFNIIKVKEAMELHGVQPPVYVWHNLGYPVLFDPNVYRTITQSDQLSDNLFGCMKPKKQTAQATSYLGCYSVTPTMQKIMFTGPDMHIRYCAELCHGQDLPLAVLQNDSCSCTDDDTLEKYGIESTEYCNISCAAASHQACGGANSMSIYDNRKISTSVKFTNCYDLYSQGFHLHFTSTTNSPTVYISGTKQVCTLESLYDSTDTACPQGYRQYQNNCYKFVTTAATAFQAQQNCISENGDLTTLTDDEAIFFWTTIKRFPSLQQYQEWHVGIYKQDSNWTYINGQPIDRHVRKKAQQNTAEGHCGAIRIAADIQENYENNEITYYYTITLDECSNREIPYICKINPYYLGITSISKCGHLSDALQNSLITISPLISITACQQLCIGHRSEYSISHVIVNESHCICTPNDMSDHQCKYSPSTKSMTRCNGNTGQFCGGNEEYSIYGFKSGEIKMYNTHNYEGECNELLANAIRVSGIYGCVTDNKQLVGYCHFFLKRGCWPRDLNSAKKRPSKMKGQQ